MDRRKVKSQKLKVKSRLGGFNFVSLVFGAQPTPLGQIGGKEGFGPWGNLGSQGIKDAAGALTSIISRTIGVMTIVAGIWFIFQFIIGAYGYMTAGGDQQKMTNATKRITNSLIGLVVVVAAYAIMSLLGALLGFNFLNIVEIINLLKP